MKKIMRYDKYLNLGESLSTLRLSIGGLALITSFRRILMLLESVSAKMSG